MWVIFHKLIDLSMVAGLNALHNATLPPDSPNIYQILSYSLYFSMPSNTFI